MKENNDTSPYDLLTGNEESVLDLKEDIDYIIQFLDYLKYIKNFSERTIVNYSVDMKQFLSYLSQLSKHIVEMDKRGLRNYLSYLRKQGYSNKSIHRKASSLKSLYKYLTKEKIIENNPSLTLSSPKVEKKLPEILSINEIEKLLDSFEANSNKEIRDHCILEILYSTGIRASELSGILIEDIDMFSKSIKVLGKGNKERIVFITKRSSKILRKYLPVREKILIDSNSRSRYLFLTLKGTKLNQTHIYSIVKSHSNKLTSGKKITPHTFRHSFATHLMNNGADIRLIQEFLGHKSIRSTQVYTHVSKERLREIYRKTHPHSKN